MVLTCIIVEEFWVETGFQEVMDNVDPITDLNVQTVDQISETKPVFQWDLALDMEQGHTIVAEYWVKLGFQEVMDSVAQIMGHRAKIANNAYDKTLNINILY